jgi:hypothetical protein
MPKLLFIIILIVNLYSDEKWNKLLHHYDGENQIVSSEFYLTNNINSTPKEELKETLKLLNSKFGKKIACNFPARYNYLKSNNYDIQDFDLLKCDKLNDFIQNFNKDKVSLVFTSEYTNNPSSAFGHTMLLFSDDNKSLNIGDAVHFVAKTNNKDGFFSYAKKGLNGSYNGYFLREPFFKKIYEYNTLEQRYMYIYTLDFSKKQILQLLYHLFELRKATFKYYFLDGNCASQTTDLLNTVTDNYRQDSIYYLPINAVQNNEKNIIEKTRFIPLINKLTLLLDKMTSTEKQLFNQIIENNLQVTKSMPHIVKEAMVYYSTFYFRKFHRVYKNYNSIMKQNYQRQIIKDKSLDPLEKTKPSNIGLGLYTQNNTNYLYFYYRPLFIDMFDIQLNSLQESEIDIFTFDAILNEENSKLLKFNFLNIKSFSTQSNFYKPMSWAIYSGINRNNKDNSIKFNNEIGFGKTFSLIKSTTINMLFYFGNDNSNIYIKPYFNINTYLSNNSKIGISTYYKKYDRDNYYNNRIFISYKYDNLLYSLEYNKDNSTFDEKYLISIKYNF